MDADRKRKLVEDQETETKRAKETTEGVLEEDKCDIPELNPRGLESPEVGVDEEITGNPPRNLARHGPGFLSLGVDQRKWLRQIHHRLGHPDTETLIRYLRSANAEQAVLEGARDFQCDACVEARKGFDLPQAGAIHEDIGFNHTLGMYGVVWTNAHGTTFEFIHVIDEGTLFHVSRPGRADSQTQWNFLEDHGFGLAGYPRVLYVDPAKGYLSEYWLSRTQELGIDLKVSAKDSHWQLGRVEAHGAILKGMLTRMDVERSINDAENFRKALIQACHAKNTLTRKSGYSPEQAVLGKSTRLPGSVISDEDATSHAKLVDEGNVTFKETLDLRETARKAFISLDNSINLRRIMLRRSRPLRANFEVGDLVLYWRRKGGNMRRERGQWFGPARVVLVESKRVVWLVHAHRLVRASPQQLRVASMREWKAVRDTEEFKVPTREWAIGRLATMIFLTWIPRTFQNQVKMNILLAFRPENSRFRRTIQCPNLKRKPLLRQEKVRWVLVRMFPYRYQTMDSLVTRFIFKTISARTISGKLTSLLLVMLTKNRLRRRVRMCWQP